MKVEELIRSLQNFELAINDKSQKKNKGIAFLPNTSDDQTDGDFEADKEI